MKTLSLLYFTTIALYIGNHPFETGDTVRQELDARTAKYNRVFKKISYIGLTRRTLDGKFMLLDPSKPELEKFLCLAPSNNGHFCRAVYALNASSRNFEPKKMEEHRGKALKNLMAAQWQEKYSTSRGPLVVKALRTDKKSMKRPVKDLLDDESIPEACLNSFAQFEAEKKSSATDCCAGKDSDDSDKSAMPTHLQYGYP